MTRLSLAALALGALVTVGGGRALAEGPVDPSEQSFLDWASWRHGMAAINLVPADCEEVLEQFLAERAATPRLMTPAVALQRLMAAPSPDPLAPFAAQGLPFMDDRSERVVRVPARFDAELQGWRPKVDGRATDNRGVALLEVGERQLWVFDHTHSPVSGATSIWEVDGKRLVERGAFWGEILATEDRGERVFLRVEDNFNAVGVEWDKARGELVGTCTIDAQALASAAEDVADRVRATVPAVFAVRKGKPAPLYLIAPVSPDLAISAYKLGAAPAGTRGVVLFDRGDGWSLVLVPAPAGGAMTKLFARPPHRSWKTAWMATSSVVLGY